jgi:hypothetical protein
VTDTRLPEHYLTSARLDGLSDHAFRVFINSLMWSVTHGTDGAVPRRALRWLHPDATSTPPAVDELVRAGLWAEAPDGWSIPDFLRHQSSAAEVRAGRDRAAATKRRQRAHARDDHSLCSPDNCSVVRMSTVDKGSRPGGTPEDRTGQDSSRGDHLQSYAARASDDGRSPPARALALRPAEGRPA